MAAMESLETLVAHIQALTKPEELAQLQSLLKQSDEALRSQAANLPPLLSQLDPSKHSLGFLYLLGINSAEMGSPMQQCSDTRHDVWKAFYTSAILRWYLAEVLSGT